MSTLNEQAETLARMSTDERDNFVEIGRAHVRTPVTSQSRMPSSA